MTLVVSSLPPAAGSAGVYWLTHESNTYAMRLYDRVATKTGFLHYQKPSE